MKMEFRVGTQDQMTIREVLEQNCYLLPDRMEGDVVIDAGAHIGCFSVACLQRGCKEILAVEPCPSNARLYRVNTSLANWPTARLYEAALGNSDLETTARFHLQDPRYTACGSTITGLGVEVRAIPLSLVLREASGLGRLILKIDVEGAEYGALYSCPHLQELDVIMGESHQLTIEAFKEASDGRKWPMDHAGLLCYLSSLGFKIACRPMSPGHPGVNVAFWAWKPDCDFLGKDFHPEPLPGSVLA